jgi:serine protease Do
MRLKGFVLTVAALLAVAATGARGAPPRRQQASGPAGAHTDDRGGSVADPSGFQKRIQTTVEKTLPTVVSFIGAAGVIISPEGLVLSQAHVTHPDDAKPGAKTRVFLYDGTAAEAELLGADRLHDVSLLRLTKPGPYPFAPLADRHPAPGDLVLKMGYPAPLRYRKDRPPEVRLGTVLAATSDAFLTDCRINGGDSGGPYFDLDGRVVGILKASGPVLDEPAQEGKALFAHNLTMPRGGFWWRGTPSTLIRARLARMERGEILTTPEPAQAGAPAKGTGLLRDLLAEDRRTQGKSALGRFRRAVTDARRSVVEILDGVTTTTFGTVVDPDGLVLTKASEVPDGARCRLPGGRVAPTEVVGIDPAYDLALLRVPASGLVPVAWAKPANPRAGTLLAAARAGELPVATGIVSIPRRDTLGPHPSLPSRYGRPPAGAPVLTGRTEPGVGYRVKSSEGNAAAAGIRAADVILTIAGSPVPDNSEIMRCIGRNSYDEAYFTFRFCLEDRRTGERLPVRLERDGRQMELTMELEAAPDPEYPSEFTSQHADAPPTVITADIPVLHNECGTPAVGVDGEVVGVIISRFGPSGSFIIPGDRVASRLADLKAGKPFPGFPVRAAKPPATASGADPHALEEQLKSVASKVTPCAVAVGGGQLGGSGVIVSADGLVLTQSHCAPDATVTIGLPGGTEEIADVVGRDEVYDLGLLKLRKPGPYPHVDFAETMPKLESWVATAGYPYPLGYRKGRPPEVRLGKLLYASEIDFLTDCPQDGGDSGAPYFDLNGRLIGIVDGSTFLSDLLFPDFSWNLGRAWMRGTPLKEVRSRFERMARGEKNIPLSRGELSFTDRGVRVRFSDLIPKERHSHGIKTLEAFGEANAGVKESVVQVLDGNEPAALGAVVDADGLVLTKASEVPDGVRCRLADGRVLAAQVVGIDPAYDLALLRVPASGLRPVAWAASGEPSVGTLVAVAGPGPLPVKIGNVSLPLLLPSGPFEKTVARRPVMPAMPPAVLGSGVPGRGYWVEYVEGNAAAAGIRPGDLLVSVAGVPIRSHEDVTRCVEGQRGGSQVPVQLLRAGKVHHLTLPLKTEAPTEGYYRRRRVMLPAPWLGIENYTSRHRHPPPAAIPVAVPVMPYECGGPMIDLDGKGLGWVYARVACTFALVVPADRVVQRLNDLKQGRPLGALPPQAPTVRESPAPKPANATLEEVITKLKERTDRYRSLLVEYDITTEADVDPQLLVAWQLSLFRDYHERHRIAFLGPKRLTEITVPQVSAYVAPAYAVTPDPAAPKDVSERLAKAQSEAAQARDRGLIHWQLLDYRQTSGMRRFVFDSKTVEVKSVYEDDRFEGFLGPTDYLANIGLRPISPTGDLAEQQAWQLPGNFARLPHCRVRPNEEQVDGAGCVVLEVPLKEGTETIWLDPGLGYSPRKWEVRAGTRLVWRRTSTDYREFAPGCWLPLEAAASFGPPAWTSLVPPDHPVYTQRMSLRYVRVNDVPDSIFTDEARAR